MAMNGNALGDAIKDAVDLVTLLAPGNRTYLFRAIGNAIVDYVQANAEVTTTGTATGVTTGAGTAPTTSTGTVS